MAEWIAWQKGLCGKPKIMQIAAALGVTEFDAAARCMVVWEWFDSHTVDGYAQGITADRLSALLRLPGVCEAMRKAGWLLEDRSGLHVENWTRWNGESAKARLRHADRQRAYRDRKRDDGVTKK